MIGPENKGLSSMFTMMNLERIVVGIQGLGISETAYQNALSYAKERKQGKANNSDNKDADFIILDNDIIRSSEARIPNTNVVATFINGELVFNRRYN